MGEGGGEGDSDQRDVLVPKSEWSFFDMVWLFSIPFLQHYLALVIIFACFAKANETERCPEVS